tara:strand:+ start:45 stop:410 length:366 start_codon:yes stop_codon:yes gene_type:complete
LEIALIEEAVVRSSERNSEAILEKGLNEVDLEIFFARKGTICPPQSDKFDDTVAFAGWVMLNDRAYLTAAASVQGGVIVQSANQALPLENCLNLMENDKAQLASMQRELLANFCGAIKNAT